MASQLSARIEWIDGVKAIGIFLMVLCHAKLSNSTMVDAIYIFHMPLFFIVSGYLDKKKEISMSVIIKCLKTLIIPYFFFSVCSLSICWISPKLHPEIYHMESWGEIFLSAIIGMFLMDDRVTDFSFMPSGPLWFLVAMFQVKILFSVVVYFYHKNKLLLLPFIFLLIVIYKYNIPFFSVDSALLAFPFYLIGFLLHELRIIDFFQKSSCYIINFLWGILLLYLVLYGLNNGRVEIDGGLYGNNIFLFYLNGTAGTLMCIFFAQSLPKAIKFTSECGRSTITILGTHLFFLIPFQIFWIVVFHFSMTSLPIFCSIIVAIVACIGGVIIHLFLNKYFPILIGK